METDNNGQLPGEDDPSTQPQDSDLAATTPIPPASPMSRRRFLQILGAVGVGAVASSLQVPEPVSRALASDLADFERAKALTSVSPAYQHVIQELGKKGFTFDFANSLLARHPSNPAMVALEINAVVPLPSKTASRLAITVNIKDSRLISVQYIESESLPREFVVNHGLVVSQTNGSLVWDKHQGRVSHSDAVPGTASQQLTSSPPPEGAGNRPQKAQVGPNGETPDSCAEEYWTECTDWYACSECVQYSWCYFPTCPDPFYLCTRACDWYACRPCSLHIDCNIYCGSYQYYFSYYNIPCSSYGYVCA